MRSKNMLAHRRHDITDKVWSLLEPYLPGRKGSWGGVAKDNRTFINAVFWILHTVTVERFATRLRALEQCSSKIYKMER